MHPRPCGPTPKWGVGKLTWDGESAAWVDEEGNRRPADQRAQDKRSRRKKTKAQKERAAKTERARKKRLKDEATKEKERRMKQALETPAGGAEDQPPHGAPPGAGAPKKQKPEHRKNGYDTNNDLNQLLTQCLLCPVNVKDRTRGAILNTVITQITYVEDHCDMDNYREAEVDGHFIVSALLLVRDELRGKDPEVRHEPPAGISPKAPHHLLLRWCLPCDACAVCCGRPRGLATRTTSRSSCVTCCSRHLAKRLCVPW